MSKKVGFIVLAAGKGTRMKTSVPKPLLGALGQTLLDYVLQAIQNFSKAEKIQPEIILVVGHKKEEIETYIKGNYGENFCQFAWQKEQKGTADAVKAAFEHYPELWNRDDIFITCGDAPLLTSFELTELWKQSLAHSQTQAIAATFETKQPTGYGRIVRASQGFSIVEEKDASLDQKRIEEVNSGLYLVKSKHLKDVLYKIDNKNQSHEFYLTDLFKPNYLVEAIRFSSEDPFLGVNTQGQWQQVRDLLLKRKIENLIQQGVIFHRPETCYIEESVQIASGVEIFPSVVIEGKTQIAEGVIIESGCTIKNSEIASFSQIFSHSYLEEVKIDQNTQIGPFARLRPGTHIHEKAKVGNFVEIKKSQLREGAKVSHLSYVGDADIGANSNIGCGFITCNYDGAQKHKTVIGAGTFIGSDVQVIAPLEIGDRCFVAAGSTITKSMPDGAFAIGRAQQVTKEGAAKRFLKSK